MCACKPAATCTYHNSKLWSQERRDSWNAYQRSRYKAKKGGSPTVESEFSYPKEHFVFQSEHLVQHDRNSPAGPVYKDGVLVGYNSHPLMTTRGETPLLPWEETELAAEHKTDDLWDLRDYGGYAPYNGEKLYHGSPIDIEVGEIVMPEKVSGFAYATPDLNIAVTFSTPVSNTNGVTLVDGTEVDAHTGERYIYEVEPINPDQTYHTRFGGQGRFDKTNLSSTYAYSADLDMIVGANSELETVNLSGYRIVSKRLVTPEIEAEAETHVQYIKDNL